MAKRRINKNIVGSVSESDALDGTFTATVFDRKTGHVYYTCEGIKTFDAAYQHAAAQCAIIRSEGTL
jgi:hypothetical protein